MYDHTLYCGRKHFCRYCLQALSVEATLKRHVKDFFKVKCKIIIMPKKGKYVKFKYYERNLNSC